MSAWTSAEPKKWAVSPAQLTKQRDQVFLGSTAFPEWDTAKAEAEAKISQSAYYKQFAPEVPGHAPIANAHEEYYHGPTRTRS